MNPPLTTASVYPQQINRRAFIGGSEARIIMGSDSACSPLAREAGARQRRQTTRITSSFSSGWLPSPSTGAGSRTTGEAIKEIQSWIRHPVIRWMAATLDGIVEDTGAVFEAKFMLPWSFSEEAAVEKHLLQLQHNVVSIVTGGGKASGPVSRGRSPQRLPQAHARPTPIFTDKSYPGCFQRFPNASARFIRHFGSRSCFQTFDSWKRHPCTLGEL
jgi:hypothetical protein